MNRILKIIGIVVGAVVVLVVVAAVAVGMLFDPNDYKDQITAAVARSTGRQLTLDGKLDLAVFPTVRIAVGSASLSNAPGFGAAPMAKIGSAELSLALLPLLSGNVKIGEATLHGLELNLARDARGRNNWQDIGSGATPANAPAAPSASGKPLDIGIGSVSISDARVTWADASTGSRWELTSFNLDADGFGPGRKFPLDMQFALAGDGVAVKVKAKTQATLALADDEYELDDLVVEIAGSGAKWPGGEGKANLEVQSFGANLGKETLDLKGLTLQFLGVTMAGSLSGQKLLSNLALAGAVDIREFNPQDVLGALKVPLETADGKVLRSASAKANLSYTSSQINLRDLQLKLDDSTLTGRIGLEGERLTYNLNVDDINIDRYLPPSDKSGAAADEGSLDAVDLPLDALRALNASGDLKFGQAKFSGLTLTNAAFALTAAKGSLRLTPSANLYGGKYTGTIDVDVQNGAARLAAEQQLTGVDLGPLGRDLLESEDIKGKGDVRLKLVTAGTNLGAMRKDLDGDVSFTIANGSIEGIDLWFELRRARARLDKTDLPERGDAVRRTSFASLSASGVVEDAVLTNRDLNGKLDFMNLTGMGTVNLLTDAIDFDLKATFVDGPTLQSDPAMAKYAGAVVPFRATGTVAAPSILPDFGAIAKQRVTNEVNERVEEKSNEIRDRLRDRLKNLRDKDKVE